MAKEVSVESPAYKLMTVFYKKFWGISNRRIINEFAWIEANPTNDETVALRRIACVKRGEGYASKALDVFCALADENKCDLILSVEPFDVKPSEGKRLTKPLLHKWYGSRGFVKNSARGQNIMIRKFVEKT